MARPRDHRAARRRRSKRRGQTGVGQRVEFFEQKIVLKNQAHVVAAKRAAAVGDRPEMVCPAQVMSPSTPPTRPAMANSKVDLPAPDGPRTHTVSPAWTVKAGISKKGPPLFAVNAQVPDGEPGGHLIGRGRSWRAVRLFRFPFHIRPWQSVTRPRILQRRKQVKGANFKDLQFRWRGADAGIFGVKGEMGAALVFKFDLGIGEGATAAASKAKTLSAWLSMARAF